MTTPAITPLSVNAQIILCKRYLVRDAPYQGQPCPLGSEWTDETGTLHKCEGGHESVDDFFERISMGRADYREMLESLDFLPNSPTLFNLGTRFGGTLSACFKFGVEDTLFDAADGIMPTVVKAVKVLKAGGGVGYSFGKVRPEGSKVASTHRAALGPLGVMRMLHRNAVEITQGGKRDAAQMAILPVDHPDIRKFIHAKDLDPDSLSTFNLSVAVTNTFMGDASTPGHASNLLFREMAESAWRTGDPGLFFYDAANSGNTTPWVGTLEGTNPCGEVPLFDDEPCNLGSINLSHMISAGAVDWPKLRDRTRLAVEYLDDALDANVFPDPAISAAALRTRKTGLGVCGFADMLATFGIQYDSWEAVELAHKLMENICGVADERSRELGEERGFAPCYAEDGAQAYLHVPTRNVTRTCIAPTGTIAILMGASSGIEPHFSLTTRRLMGDGTVLAESAGEYGEFVPHISEDIDPRWHIRHQAAFQSHTDLAVSKTINLPASATVGDVADAYLLAWTSGCKGVTVYRDGSRTGQVLVHQGREAAPAIASNGQSRRKLPDERQSITNKFTVGEQKGYFTVGYHDDGDPGELFIKIAKQGSEVNGLYDAIGILTSIALQYGAPFATIAEKMANQRFDPSGMTRDQDVPTATSVLDYIYRKIAKRHDSLPTILPAEIGMRCPDCDGPIRFAEGCWACAAECGWSKC